MAWKSDREVWLEQSMADMAIEMEQVTGDWDFKTTAANIRCHVMWHPGFYTVDKILTLTYSSLKATFIANGNNKKDHKRIHHR